jgi:hypothetical protein
MPRAELAVPMVLMWLTPLCIAGLVVSFGDNFYRAYSLLSGANASEVFETVQVKFTRSVVAVLIFTVALIVRRFVLIVLLIAAAMVTTHQVIDFFLSPAIALSDSNYERMVQAHFLRIIALTITVRGFAMGAVYWALYVVLSYHWRHHRQAGCENISFT